MPKTTEARHQPSPLALITELVAEATSSLIEAQRISLHLAKQENDIVMNGIKERMGGFTPGEALTEIFRHGLDTAIGMQQDFLTATSKQTAHWLETVQAGKGYDGARVLELAREGIDDFVRAQHKFLDVLAQETGKVTRGRHDQHKPVKKTELSQLAREATTAFIEAQKKMLDVVGQQMNVNLNTATRVAETLSPRFSPMTRLPGEAMKAIVGAEKTLVKSVIEPGKKIVSIERKGRKPRKKIA